MQKETPCMANLSRKKSLMSGNKLRGCKIVDVQLKTVFKIVFFKYKIWYRVQEIVYSNRVLSMFKMLSASAISSSEVVHPVLTSPFLFLNFPLISSGSSTLS